MTPSDPHAMPRTYAIDEEVQVGQPGPEYDRRGTITSAYQGYYLVEFSRHRGYERYSAADLLPAAAPLPPPRRPPTSC